VAEAFRKAYPDIRVIYASGSYHDGERRVPDSAFFTKPYIANDIVEAAFVQKARLLDRFPCLRV